MSWIEQLNPSIPFGPRQIPPLHRVGGSGRMHPADNWWSTKMMNHKSLRFQSQPHYQLPHVFGPVTWCFHVTIPVLTSKPPARALLGPVSPTGVHTWGARSPRHPSGFGNGSKDLLRSRPRCSSLRCGSVLRRFLGRGTVANDRRGVRRAQGGCYTSLRCMAIAGGLFFKLHDVWIGCWMFV